jgi:hypothetical protein
MKLNCKAGDLAITVTCFLTANKGRIVEVVSAQGLMPWDDLGTVFVWNIKAPEGSPPLVYLRRNDLEFAREGLCPDVFLRPIAPGCQILDIAQEASLAIEDWR